MNVIRLFSLLLVILLITACTNTTPDTTSDKTIQNNLSPVTSFSHAHGMAVDPSDSSKLYIATHEGLFVLVNEKDLFQIGKSQDDYMGFSIAPGSAATRPIFFSSGHPQIGGNIGVQRSDDGGVSWKKISDGVNGPVDFHTMTVSSVNPNLMYGWYGGLQRSIDGGKNWEMPTAQLPNIIQLLAHPKEENTVFATTVQGIWMSQDKGTNWSSLTTDLSRLVITAAWNPQDPKKSLSNSQELGLAKSDDGGKSWKKIEADFRDDTIIYLAYDPQKAETVYALTKGHIIYKSTDSGTSWSKIY